MSTAAVPVTPRACPECVAHDEDPAPWCDCEADGTTYCAGPCRNRAHDPDQCPRVGVTPGATTAEDDVNDLAAANDWLRTRIEKLEAELRYIREAAARGVMPGCRDCDLDTHTCGGCGRSHPHGESYCPECAHQDCWEPIPLRWRHVRPGDVVVLKDKLWEVTATDTHEQWAEAFVARGEKTHRADLDPDATVPVLVRHQEREALQLARAQLGATVVDRRV